MTIFFVYVIGSIITMLVLSLAVDEEPRPLVPADVIWVASLIWFAVLPMLAVFAIGIILKKCWEVARDKIRR